MMHFEYLKAYRRGTYTALLTEGKLNKHLCEIDLQVKEMIDLIIVKMSEQENVTETLKATNPLEWVGRMNNIRSQASEIVIREIVYN